MGTATGSTRASTACYVEDMLRELRTMAQQMDCDLLTYLIEMAMIEASDIASGKMSVGRRETLVANTARQPTAQELADLYLSGKLD